jgi:hypothetical protein
MSGSSRAVGAIALLLVFITTCAGDGTPTHNPGGYPLDLLEDDFDQYVRLIHLNHPKTFTDTAHLQQTITGQRAMLRDGMTETEFFGVLAPVGAAVRCGHTRTRLSESGEAWFGKHGLCLPLDIRLVNDSLYVYRDFTPDRSVPRAGRIVSIDNRPAAAIIARMRESQYADGTNVTYRDYAINLWFARLYSLLFGGSQQFPVEVVAPGAAGPVTHNVAALTPEQRDRVDESRYGMETSCGRLCTTISEDGRYAVLTVRDFGYYGDVDAFRKPVATFFARLARDSVETLIIDVRGNDGGDPYCSSFVVSHVVPEPVRYFAAGTRFYDDLVRPIPVPDNVFTGKLFVLTDGWCFSSTGHMLSLLRCLGRGVFVGEESGGSTACNDASREHVLDHTGIRINLPRATFATSAKCLPWGRGIPPGVPVSPSIDDIVAGRDVVLEKAISLAGSQ